MYFNCYFGQIFVSGVSNFLFVVKFIPDIFFNREVVAISRKKRGNDNRLLMVVLYVNRNILFIIYVEILKCRQLKINNHDFKKRV